MMKGPWYYRFWWLIKVSVFLLSCWFIYFHFNQQINVLGNARSSLTLLFNPDQRFLLIIVLLLAVLNWSLEAWKWKFLMLKIETVSFLRAIRAVCNGITISFFTPNRSGEFAGRIIYLQKDHRIQGALLSLVGSTAQLLITFQMGLLGCLIFLPGFIELEGGQLAAWRWALAIALVVISYTWWRMPRLVRLTDTMNIRSSWKEKAHIWDQCSHNDLIKVWTMSLLRYLLFTFQQILFYRILGFCPPLFEMAGLSAISFMLITAIPSIALGELGIRGSVNIAIFGWAGAVSSDILLVTFCIWCLNLAVPALLGAFSVLFLKVKNKVVL